VPPGRKIKTECYSSTMHYKTKKRCHNKEERTGRKKMKKIL